MNTTEAEQLASQIEGDFIAFIDEFHSHPEVWDDGIKNRLMQQYIDVKPVFPKKPYFSPSSTNSCPRELYLKGRGAKRENSKRQPHQARWQRMGTVGGDILQEDILKAEKHFEKLTGNPAPFWFEKNDDGTPMFEEFAKTNKKITHNGEMFYLFGSPDGIMTYVNDNGEKIRVGLEVKSKQTTAARTSAYSMRAPELSHVKQSVAYSAMFDCDFYMVVYVNMSKKSWSMTDEEYAKTPDLRAFCMHFTDEDRAKLFDELADNVKAQREGNPPKLDIEKFTFNNFKSACANDLSQEEVGELAQYVQRVAHSSMPDWKKRAIEKDFETIVELRKKGGKA